MAKIDITEDDFDALADAANNAKSEGNYELAMRFDMLARKANAALTNQKYSRVPKLSCMKKLTYSDAPSSLI